MDTEKSIIITAVSFGLLLLITPPPPQIAIFTFVAIMLLGFTVVLGYRNILHQIEATRSEDDSEEDQKNEFERELEHVHEQYTKKNGITEAQLEKELEELHDKYSDSRETERIDRELEQLQDQHRNDIDPEAVDEELDRLTKDRSE